ncbi:MAG: hypothetical protein WAT66_05380 [Actinomycetota bacterium]
MTATETFRRSHLRRRAVEFAVSFILVLTVAVGLIGVLAANARAGIGCTAKAIAVSSSQCGGLNPGPAAHADVRVVFEADTAQPGR